MKAPVAARLTVTNEEGTERGEIYVTTDCVISETGEILARFANAPSLVRHHIMEMWFPQEPNGNYPYHIVNNYSQLHEIQGWETGPYKITTGEA